MFENMTINFVYSAGGKKNKVSFDKSYTCSDFDAFVDFEAENNIEKLKVSVAPVSEIEIEAISIEMKFPFNSNHKIFVNGYQSWTDSREFFVDEKLRTISKLMAPMMNKYQFDKYGDYTFKKYSEKVGEFHGYTYSYIREGEDFSLIGSLTERSGYTIIEQYVNDNRIVINKECKGLTIKDTYTPFELVYAQESEEFVFDTYFELMNIKKPRCKPTTGWTSWYNYYQNINEDIILENLNNFKEMNKNIEMFQIDDGYQTAVGDWLSIDKAKFPNGMKYIADSIKAKGYKAGIWLAPFACETTSKIFKEKKDWILKNAKGELVLGGGNWSRFYALDIYNNEVREYIKHVFSVVLNEWGYDMVKLDFLYAVCLLPRKDKTRGQIMTEAMEFIRECVGDKLILGCGVPLGPAFGLVDYCRIGCDVSLDWDDKPYMRLAHRERVSTLNAINNAIGRRQLNGRAFLNDPDVFLLRDDNIKLTNIQKETLSTVNHIFGSLIFTSDNLKKYDASKHAFFDSIMNLKDKKIERVERFKDGLVEVVFNEEDSKYLALINTSEAGADYKNPWSNVKEIFLGSSDIVNIYDRYIEVEPYKSRLFKVEEN